MASDLNTGNPQDKPMALFTGNSQEYVTNVLKTQFGNSDDFLAFERHFYYQTEELKLLKNVGQHNQATIIRLQEEKRKLELQLMSEKVLRDQESKNAAMEIEKSSVQQNAQMYGMKCEIESWKRKAEAVGTESTWLKEQLKIVELEKNQAMQKLVELKANLHDFDRHRQSFQTYSKRQKELMQASNKKLDELEKAKEAFEKITESNQKQLDMVAIQLGNWKNERGKCNEKIAELSKELVQVKAEISQSKSKLARAELAEKNNAELLEKLINENRDLKNGLTSITSTVGHQIRNTYADVAEKADELNNQFKSSMTRLSLDESHFM